MHARIETEADKPVAKENQRATRSEQKDIRLLTGLVIGLCRLSKVADQTVEAVVPEEANLKL